MLDGGIHLLHQPRLPHGACRPDAVDGTGVIVTNSHSGRIAAEDPPLMASSNKHLPSTACSPAFSGTTPHTTTLARSTPNSFSRQAPRDSERVTLGYGIDCGVGACLDAGAG